MTDLVPSRGSGGSLPQGVDSDGRGASTVPAYVDYVDLDRDDEIDLRELLLLLRRRWRTVLGVTALIVAAAAWWVLRQRPVYEADATIRLKDERGALTGVLEQRVPEEILGRQSDPLLSKMEVLKSATIVGGVVDRLGLRASPVDAEWPRSWLVVRQVPTNVARDTFILEFGSADYRVRYRGQVARAPYGQEVEVGGLVLAMRQRPDVEATPVAIEPRHRVIEALQKAITVRNRRNTDVIDVSFRDHDPVHAQQVVNTLIDVFQEYDARQAQEKSRRRRLFIEEQMRNTERDLALAQSQLSAFRRQRQVFSSQQQFAAQQQMLLELEARRDSLAAARAAFQSLLASLQRNPQDPSVQGIITAPEIAANPVIAQLYTQYVRLQLSRDSLISGPWGSTRTNPDVQRLEALIASTQARLRAATQSYLQTLDARLRAMDEQRAKLASIFQVLPDAEAEEVRLRQRLEAILKVADQLREEYQKARIAEAVEAGQVEVVDRAERPIVPVPQRRGLKLALATMLGLFFGGSLALLLESLNTKVRRPEDLENLLKVPNLVLVPSVTGDGTRPRQVLPVPFIGRDGADRGELPLAESLIIVRHPHAPASEAYRALRTSLLFAQSVPIRRVVITSAGAAEGKTTVASNLAAAFAQQGMRVVLVDADLRRPAVHEVFGVPREPGLSNVLVRQATLDQTLRPAPIEGLRILTAGTLPPNPAELLGSPAMDEVLEQLDRSADLVVLDTPPVLAAADAAVLAPRVEGVVLVARAGRVNREAVLRAFRQLQSVNARILGTVLNDPDAEVPRYVSSEAYAYYYQYYGRH